MRAQVMKWGNSLAVRIPKSIADEAKVKAGDPLEIEVLPEGAVQHRRAGKVPTLAQLVARITPENRYGEVAAGPDVGRETVEW